VEGARLTLVGALNVERGPASAAGVGVTLGATFDALQLELYTRGEAVTVESLVLSLSGSADDRAAVAGAELWLDADGDGAAGDGDRVLAGARADADDGRLEFAGLDLVIPSGEGLTVLARLSIDERAAAGGTVRVGLAKNDDVRARGETSGALSAVGAPLTGSLFTLVEPLPLVDGGPPVDQGCGCSSTRQPGTDASALLLGLALVLAHRARRRPSA
jgi:MYXO-CTERM domain-containing protein